MHKHFNKRGVYWGIFIFACAVLVRCIYMFQMKNADPLFFHPVMDALYHHEWAQSLINVSWLGNESFFRAPLYPYFLALVYSIGGINLIIPRIVQIIIGALSCLLTERIGTHFFGKKIGIGSGFVAAFYPLFIYFDNELLIPTILIFLILGGFYLIIKQSRHGTKVGWFVTGIIWGLAAITRPNVLLFLIILPLYLRKKLKQQIGMAIAYGSLGVVLIIAPITLRNYIVSREFVPIAWQGGVNFYIGNNPNSDGKTAIIPGTRKSWRGGFLDAKRIAEETMGRPLKNPEIDRYWLSQGLKFITTMPGEAFLLYLNKVYLFFSGYEISNNRDLYFFSRPTFLKFLFFKLRFFQFPFGLLFPLSLIGSWYAFKKKKDISLILIFIIPYSFSFILFFICARYRLPIIPFLIILACYAVSTIIGTIKQKKYKNMIPPLIILIASLTLFNANLLGIKDNPAVNHLLLADVEYSNSNYRKALYYLKMALPFYSHDAEVLNPLGMCYYQLGEYDNALKYYFEAIQIAPNQSEAYNNIGIIYNRWGQYNEAKPYFTKAIELNSKFALAYYNLGNAYFAQDSLHKTLYYYKKAISLAPNFINALFYSGVVEYRLGNLAEAKALWRKVLTIQPQHQDALHALRSLMKK